MIASKIGKTFLKAYNQKYDKEYSAKEFFEEVYWEIFYNHPKYFFWPGNSEFVQGIKTLKSGKIGKDIKENGKTLKFESIEKANEYSNSLSLSKEEEIEIRKVKNKKVFTIVKTLDNVQRKELLSNFNHKIVRQLAKHDIDYTFVIGYPASEETEFATTSGLVTDIEMDISENEVYYSWLGGALGVGVGQFSILFDNPEILLATFEGWKVYRQFLNDESLEKLAGNKINSWNGQWLNYYFSEYYYEKPDFSILSDEKFFKETNDGIVIDTIKWSRLFFNLSRKLSNNTLTGYVYSLGKTNKTIGFIPFRFSDAKSLSDTYKKLFGEFDAMEQLNAFEELLGGTINEACKLGAIGIQALQPKDLFKDILKNKKLNLIKYRTYKTWIIVMINKEETLQLTTEIAKLLHLFLKGSKGTERKNLIDILFQSGKRNFLFYWEEIIKHSSPEDKKIQKEMSDKIFYMNKEEFGYFIVLSKLDFRYQEN